jgi:hypothetical protein
MEEKKAKHVIRINSILFSVDVSWQMQLVREKEMITVAGKGTKNKRCER